jgi:hypothetical protein
MASVQPWGLSGIGALHEHVAMLVIVDAQPFSTADAAATRGAIVEPFPFPDLRGAQAAAEVMQAVKSPTPSRVRMVSRHNSMRLAPR